LGFSKLKSKIKIRIKIRKRKNPNNPKKWIIIENSSPTRPPFKGYFPKR